MSSQNETLGAFRYGDAEDETLGAFRYGDAQDETLGTFRYGGAEDETLGAFRYGDAEDETLGAFRYDVAEAAKAFVRILALSAFVACCLPAHAQRASRPPEQYVQIGKPDQAEGKKILEEFRTRIAIVGYYDFQLHLLPRRGAETVLDGKLWAAQKDGVQLLRLELKAQTDERFLIQSGTDPRIWRFTPAGNGGVEVIAQPAVPLAGTELTAFDLQMPFLYWTDFVYEGLARLGGRPAYQFILYPPTTSSGQVPGLAGVRIYLDTQYNALAQSELIGAGNKVLKTWSILELKKIGDVYIPKTIEVRNEETRNKARFSVTGAATGQTFPAEIFTPASLATEASRPQSGITKIE